MLGFVVGGVANATLTERLADRVTREAGGVEHLKEAGF